MDTQEESSTGLLLSILLYYTLRIWPIISIGDSTLYHAMLGLSFMQLDVGACGFPFMFLGLSLCDRFRLQKFSALHQNYPSWIFMASLSLSTVFDILTAVWLFFCLFSLQREIELPFGFITSVAKHTLTRLVYKWVVYPTEPMLFFGIYFFIEKIYTNFFLPIHDLRWGMWEYREIDETCRDLLIQLSHQLRSLGGEFMYYPKENIRQLEVIIEETVDYGEHSYEWAASRIVMGRQLRHPICSSI
ncbi:uncharacterized protein BT62DRAFT_924834 [Guyanagaster necrorhizus]|uniref:Uncharacterized protein n=1 Tax=Guyanagaster necrorhizus TaxID=856835 RepID=A0A9P7VEU1_9AGAR|nr:uncharacterized protein BT62DRAFT_924834 [Guyanagaster necrorhizus MCA 3950]KAG7439240.1 hypothetical protein BT62DRAFT_924834 [Guyanagaster necrorhizus MCA 3950]